jgi:hypothetical protein
MFQLIYQLIIWIISNWKVYISKIKLKTIMNNNYKINKKIENK